MATSERGVFISFEGSEGCGKTTQIKRLAARLEELKRPVLVTREPGGSRIGEEIRRLLKYYARQHEMAVETELLLFTASRAQLVREVIAPALAAGTTVICDRFMDSTTVYQGIARKIDPGAVEYINHFAVAKYRPDVTFVLDMPSDVAFHRILRRPRPVRGQDRMEQEPPIFYEEVRKGYLDLAAVEPERICVIDASRTIEETAHQIAAKLEERIHGFFPQDSV